MDVKEAMEQVKVQIRLNLFECCRELIEYSETAILCDGEVRRITQILCQNDQYPISYHDASAIVHSQIHEISMRSVMYNWWNWE
jgi:hypothetical protein